MNLVFFFFTSFCDRVRVILIEYSMITKKTVKIKCIMVYKKNQLDFLTPLYIDEEINKQTNINGDEKVK